MNAPDRTDELLSPGKLWSLWDLMITYDVGLLLTRLNHLEHLERELTGEFRYPGGVGELYFPADSSGLLNPEARQWIWAHLHPLKDLLEKLDFRAADIEIQYIWNNSHIWSASRIADALKGLRWKVEQEFRDCLFYFVGSDEKKLISQDDPFGIALKFPSAASELKSAAECICYAQGTASVFHSMRAVESGIGAMAAEVGKTFTVENWQTILNEVGAVLTEWRKNGIPGVAKAQKDSKLEYLCRAAAEIGYFKDGWRNYVSHNKRPYGTDEARDVYAHVGRFISVLSEHLSE